MEFFLLNLSLDWCTNVHLNIRERAEFSLIAFSHNNKNTKSKKIYLLTTQIFYPLSSTIYKWYKPLTKNETSNNSIFKSNESHWFNFSFISWIVVEWYAVFHVKLLCTYISIGELCRLLVLFVDKTACAEFIETPILYVSSGWNENWKGKYWRRCKGVVYMIYQCMMDVSVEFSWKSHLFS